MRKLVKIAVFTLCGLLLPMQGNTNMPVIDLSAITATIAGFVESVGTAVKSGATLLNQLDALKSLDSTMNQIDAVYKKVDAYMYNMQEIADIIETSTEIVEESSAIYKRAVSARVYEPRELAYLLDQLTAYVKDIASITQRVSAIIDPKLFKWSSAERVAGIDESKTAMTRIRNELKKLKKAVVDQTELRKNLESLMNKQLVSPLEGAYAQLAVLTGEVKDLPTGMELTLLLAKAEESARKNRETTTESTSINKLQGVAGKVAPLFWVLTAFVGLFGLLKVVRKAQAQEDVGKSISIWVTAILLLITFGQIYTMIFS